MEDHKDEEYKPQKKKMKAFTGGHCLSTFNDSTKAQKIVYLLCTDTSLQPSNSVTIIRKHFCPRAINGAVQPYNVGMLLTMFKRVTRTVLN